MIGGTENGLIFRLFFDSIPRVTMNSPRFRVFLVLWLFFSVLVSISDPTDLTNKTATAVIEDVDVLNLEEAKFKDHGVGTLVGTLVGTFSIFIVTEQPITDQLWARLTFSAPPRYQLLSTYRI